MDFGFEYHQLFEDLLQMTIDLENNLVGRFGGGRNTGTLVRMVEDINYVNDKGSGQRAEGCVCGGGNGKCRTHQ